MTKKASFFFTASCLTLFVPAPPRFGCGLVLVLCADIIILSVIMLTSLLDYVRLNKYKTPLSMLGALSITVLLQALLSVWSPVIAFMLGFIIYIIPVSLFMNKIVRPAENEALKTALRRGIKNCLLLSASALVFFVLREAAAYGSISVPLSTGLRIFTFFENSDFFPVFFWATVPGALILLAFILVALSLITRKKDTNKDIKGDTAA